MTANKLFGTLNFIVTLDDQHRLQTRLEKIRDVLNQLVQSPADPNQQSALATARSDFDKAAAQLTSITPSQAVAITEMGGAEFFDPQIAEKVKASISANAMTPSVARDFVQDLAQRRATYLQTIRTTLQGLRQLHVEQSPLQPGGADLAFLIPWDLFERQLDGFTKELRFINRLLQDVSEGLTGKRESPELESLSSSIPTITLETSTAVISVLALIVTKFLDAWERIERIRKVRDELTELGIKGSAVDEVSEQVTTTIEEIVEESTDLVIKHYSGDASRKNELHNGVATDVRRLFGQIERGLTVEFHAEPKTDADAETAQALTNIVDLSKDMKFPPAAKEPLLLAGPEVLEGELHKKTYKKTATTKTSTSSTKKEAKKESHEG